VNEIKIQNSSGNLIDIILVIVLISTVCAGIVYYYRGASGKLESELGRIEKLNADIASEAQQLQTGLANHVAGIKAIRSQTRASRERIEYLHSEIEQSAKSTYRAIEVINDCEKIIEAVKTQR